MPALRGYSNPGPEKTFSGFWFLWFGFVSDFVIRIPNFGQSTSPTPCTPMNPSWSPGDPPPAVNIMRKLGLEPDPWQIDVLDTQHPRLLLNCCRQAGKSTVVGILGLVQALFAPMTRVLLVSRSHRQSKELLRQITFYHQLLGAKLLERSTAEVLEFTNLSRIVSMPCKEETIRGFAHVDLLVMDEAARVPDDLYRAVRPMLAVSGGRLVCLSTPYGKRGFFWDAWANGGADWQRIEIPARQIARIKPEFLEQERRALGESWFRQEYDCSFEALEGLVYPDFARHAGKGSGQESGVRSQESRGQEPGIRDQEVEGQSAGGAEATLTSDSCPLTPDSCSLPTGRKVGGIDFGFRNPFAAVWGVVDREGVLWLTGEHYCRQKPLRYHAKHLPRDVTWYADPSGATEIAELRCAGFTVRPGRNALRPGIAAVAARLENGLLRVLAGRCPNLLAEAGLYRWAAKGDRGADAEAPLDEHNHALAALRYLVSRLDARTLAGPSPAPDQDDDGPRAKPSVDPEAERWQRIVDDDRYWIPLG
jgi:hypothetical protein